MSTDRAANANVRRDATRRDTYHSSTFPYSPGHFLHFRNNSRERPAHDGDVVQANNLIAQSDAPFLLRWVHRVTGERGELCHEDAPRYDFGQDKTEPVHTVVDCHFVPARKRRRAGRQAGRHA